MADGTTRKIKDVRLGDTVLATDPEAGTSATRTVTNRFAHQDTNLADITVHDSNGNRTVLNTTWNHPFYNTTRQEWVDAAHLKTGDQLYTPDGTSVTVTDLALRVGTQPMYDLIVDITHTYYVLAGTVQISV